MDGQEGSQRVRKANRRVKRPAGGSERPGIWSLVKRAVRGTERPIGGPRGQLEGIRGKLEGLGASQRAKEASQGVWKVKRGDVET